jgi:3-hydroxybutyryl-CoA dehydrogenase
MYSTAPRTNIKKIGVIGSGQMGIGISQVASQIAKINVVIVDTQKTILDKNINFMDSILAKNVAKGKMTEEERVQTRSRITGSTDIKDLKDVDFVIEAVSENLDLKHKLFRELSTITAPDVILASNTSSISITKIAAVTNRPDKVIGMHFMNPVPVMQLVEIIKGLATSTDTLDTTLQLATAMGKTTTKSEDVPGFIANRLLMPYINEAIYALYEGVGSREDIDKTMKLGTNMPMGPLTLADFIGLDTCLAIMRVLHNELGDSKYRPCPLLVKYVDAGWLGKKTGRGFYTY